MIPKILHFCWLSGDEYPEDIKKCMESWHKVLPDYEIIKWDKKRFDVSSRRYLKAAYEAKKCSFCADYIRMEVLFTV